MNRLSTLLHTDRSKQAISVWGNTINLKTTGYHQILLKRSFIHHLPITVSNLSRKKRESSSSESSQKEWEFSSRNVPAEFLRTACGLLAFLEHAHHRCCSLRRKKAFVACWEALLEVGVAAALRSIEETPLHGLVAEFGVVIDFVTQPPARRSHPTPDLGSEAE